MLEAHDIARKWKKTHKSGISRFSRYFKQLCEQSLITGFPVIVSTRAIWRRVIKILVFMGCACGFLYQTSEFLELYRSYPTMVDIQIENPDSVELPAFSFCNSNRIRRNAVCLANYNDCEWYSKKGFKDIEFCPTYPKYCSPEESDEERVLAIPMFATYMKINRSREYVKKMGETREDILFGCRVKTQTNSACRNYKDVSWVGPDGNPYNCFTVETLWGQPDEQPMKMPLDGSVSLILNLHPEQYMLYYDLVLAHLVVHEAHGLTNPFKEGIKLESGVTYDLFVNQRVTERLEAPYVTNCTNYMKLWKKNGGYGPLTGKACAEKCKMEMMLETEGCVAGSVSYPEDYVICDNITSIPDVIVEKCSRQCNEACREVSYSLRYEISFNQAEMCKPTDENCKKRNLFMNFVFNRLEVEKFVHHPRYESVEVFSYVGGYMGMWLGISLVSLFDLAETMAALIVFSLRETRRKRKISCERCGRTKGHGRFCHAYATDRDHLRSDRHDRLEAHDIAKKWKKTHKSGISRFSRYFKQLCEQSLITGFPIIVSTRAIWRRVIKILVFVGCTCGFLYQTSEFLELYRSYPTMVDIQIENPDSVELPAFSFCNSNRIRRNAVCLANYDDCAWYSEQGFTEKEFCLSYPKYCSPEESDEERVLAYPMFATFMKVNRSREYVKKMGETREDILFGCRVKTQTNSPCKHYLDVSWVGTDGNPYNCFTVETLWGQPDEQPLKMPLDGSISLILNLHPEQYMLYFDLVLAHIVVHEAHGLTNPFKEGIKLESGVSYDLFVNQRVTERLEAPYVTNCTNYMKLWKKNGGYGPLTGKACAEKCKMETMLETEGCVAGSVSYPEDYVICDNITSIPDDIVEKCSRQCNEACREVSYSLRYEISFNQAEMCKPTDENCKKRNLFMNFVFNRLEVEKFVHHPRYESVEVFSYVGGYMGMWLGISLVSLFDLAETMAALIVFPLKETRRKKKISVKDIY